METMEYRSFDSLLTQLVARLKRKNRFAEVGAHFGPHQCAKQMFHYLSQLQEVKECLQIKRKPDGKSAEESEKYRTQGNKFYRRKLFDKALDMYNISIIKAPHPPISSVDHGREDAHQKDPKEQSRGNQDYKNLALGLANRSAVLYELGQVQKCMEDIDAAINYGYPKILQCKLQERKAKCLMSQQCYKEAKSVLEQSLKTFEALHFEESKGRETKESIVRLMEKCNISSTESEKEVRKEGTERNPSDKSHLSRSVPSEIIERYSLLFSFKNPTPPLLRTPHPKVPCMSSSLRLAYSAVRGRYLVADKNIDPGEVLVVEKPFGSVLHLDEVLKSHCCWCKASTLTPLPCPNCCTVVFCSWSCRNNALATFHPVECRVMATLAALDMGKNPVLAFRLITQMGLKSLRKIVPVLENEQANVDAIRRGFNEAGVYDSQDYRTIYHTVTNQEARSVWDLFRRCTMAYVLTQLLELSEKFFVDANGEPETPSQEDLILVGHLFFRHLMSLICNAHALTEFQLNITDYQSSIYHEIGGGVFGVLSLQSHSCNPSTARSSYGQAVVLRAVRYIPKGHEVTSCYGNTYGLEDAETRKEVLLKQYFFTCVCEACRNDWPVYFGLSSSMKIACPVCRGPVSSSTANCESCKKKFDVALVRQENGSPLESFSHLLDKLNLSVIEFREAYLSVFREVVSDDIVGKVVRFIKLSELYVCLPNEEYFKAQETLKHCFDREGSCRFFRGK